MSKKLNAIADAFVAAVNKHKGSKMSGKHAAMEADEQKADNAAAKKKGPNKAGPGPIPGERLSKGRSR